MTLGHAVEVRFLRLCDEYLREKFEQLTFPSYLDSDVLLWRTMRVRHKSGDYRNTMDEIKATQRIANWTLEVKCELTGTKHVPLEWDN